MPTCPCCESNVDNTSDIYECSDCGFEGCAVCQAYHTQISGHDGNSPSSDTETSGHYFHGISRGIV